jgi:hypothetical protein
MPEESKKKLKDKDKLIKDSLNINYWTCPEDTSLV